jgi:hypothetical protein
VADDSEAGLSGRNQFLDKFRLIDVPPHANLVTASGLEALANAMANIARLTILRIRSRM